MKDAKDKDSALHQDSSGGVPLVDGFVFSGDGLTITFNNEKDGDAVADALQARQRAPQERK